MVNAISVDVEEYFHATNLGRCAPPSEWHALPSRVEQSTRTVLDLFRKCNTHGTFFVLGYVARRHKNLIREIVSEGHELASHGYAHQLAFSQTPRAFYRDVRKARYLLEDLSGNAVVGYRAPSFSITTKNPWAYDELLRAGYQYDSSIYPTWHPRYGNGGASCTPTVIERERGKLSELPLGVCQLTFLGREIRVPIAGGAYWRHFPLSVIERGISRMNNTMQLPVGCYVHPWEFDPDQPFFSELSLVTRRRHYGGIAGLARRVEFLLKKFRFAPFNEVWREQLAAVQKS